MTACFAAGTRVATELGLVAVEMLREGDMMVIDIGVTRVLRPVTRVDQRRVTVRRDATAQQPLRIRRGAFAENVPQRDLRVRPDQWIQTEDCLTPAARLVHGSAILREQITRSVLYVELHVAGHGVLLAEGLGVTGTAPDISPVRDLETVRELLAARRQAMSERRDRAEGEAAKRGRTRAA